MAIWPLFDLTVTGPRMRLRYMDDDLGERVARLAAEGIFRDPREMMFTRPWTDVPSPYLERGAVQRYWRCRAEWTPRKWTAPFAAIVGDAVVGTIDVGAEDFSRLRQVMTGSWLGLAHQGRGLGTEMRRLALALAFDGLGAERAYSAAWEDNHASLGVSRRMGYRETGRRVRLRRDEPRTSIDIVIDRETWLAQGHRDIAITGLEACAELFGLGAG